MITEFRIGCSKTINLGNFENIRVEASITVSPEEADHVSEASWDACRVAAQSDLRRLLEQTYRFQRKEIIP